MSAGFRNAENICGLVRAVCGLIETAGADRQFAPAYEVGNRLTGQIELILYAAESIRENDRDPAEAAALWKYNELTQRQRLLLQDVAVLVFEAGYGGTPDLLLPSAFFAHSEMLLKHTGWISR